MLPQALSEPLLPKVQALRFKLSLWYVCAIGLVLIFFQAILYFNYDQALYKEFDAQLLIKAEQIGGAVNTFRAMLADENQSFTLAAQKALDLDIEYPQYAFMSESAEKFWMADAKKLGLDKDYLAILDAQGHIVAGSSNVGLKTLALIKDIGRSSLNKGVFYNLHTPQGLVRLVILPYYYNDRQVYKVAVATSFGPVAALLQKHLFFVITSTLIMLAIASLMVRFFVNKVLSLEKSFAHIKEFSLEMAHEVKTPLAIISGESQQALKGEYTTEEYQEKLRAILKESQRTQRFVSDLLLLTKLDYRLIQMRFERIDLVEFLEETCEKMRLISGPSVDMAVKDGRPLWIKGDRTHLRRVFFNLIDNASRATSAAGCINIAVQSHDHEAVVTVSDTGCGIAHEKVPKIFDKFSCGGVGLNIVHSLVTMHGGRIEVDSRIGAGTTFKMTFPLMQNSSVFNV